MVGSTQILLRNLELHHHLRLLHGGEQRAIWLARLEVDGTVLDLDNHVVGKLAVQRHKLQAGLVGTIGALGRIDEGTPHDDALMRLQHLAQHVGTVGMRASEVLGAGLTLGVCLHQETTEVGNHLVYLVHLVLPPANDIAVQRVGSLQPSHLNR